MSEDPIFLSQIPQQVFMQWAHVMAWKKAYYRALWQRGLPRRTYLDDQVALRVTGHPAELGSQLLELGPAVCVNHPAWGKRKRRRRREAVDGGGGGEING